MKTIYYDGDIITMTGQRIPVKHLSRKIKNSVYRYIKTGAGALRK